MHFCHLLWYHIPLLTLHWGCLCINRQMAVSGSYCKTSWLHSAGYSACLDVSATRKDFFLLVSHPFECNHPPPQLLSRDVMSWCKLPETTQGMENRTCCHDPFQLILKGAVLLKGNSDHELGGSPLSPVLQSKVTTIFSWQQCSLWKGYREMPKPGC